MPGKKRKQNYNNKDQCVYEKTPESRKIINESRTTTKIDATEEAE